MTFNLNILLKVRYMYIKSMKSVPFVSIRSGKIIYWNMRCKRKFPMAKNLTRNLTNTWKEEDTSHEALARFINVILSSHVTPD